MNREIKFFTVVQGTNLYKNIYHSEHIFAFRAQAEADWMNHIFPDEERYNIVIHYTDGTRGWAPNDDGR